MKSLAKNSILNMGYQLLNLIFPLIASMYVARVLQATGVGKVAYAQNIASYFIVFASLGIPTHGLRMISASRNDKVEKNRIYSELLIINAMTTTLSLLLYGILVFFTPQFRNDIPLYFCSGLIIVFNYINIDWLYQGNEDYAYIVFRNIGVKIISLCALLVFVHSQDDYLRYALIVSLASCGNYLLNIINSRNKVRFTLQNLQIRRHDKPIIVFAIAYFFGTLYSRIDTTMIGMLCDQEAVGYYSYAHKILAVVLGICTAMSSAFLPRLSYYFQHDRVEFKRLINKGIQVISFIAFPSVVGLYILSPMVIEIMYGRSFLSAATTLRKLAPLIVILSFGNLLCYQTLVASGKEKLLIPACGIAAMINIGLNALLIPRFSQDGAAVASVITELFICGVELLYVLKNIQIKLNVQQIVMTCFCSLVMGLCVIIVIGFVDSLWGKVILGMLTGLITYLGVCLLTKNQMLIYLKGKVLHFIEKK